MRVLFTPKKFVLKCPVCSTYLEFEGNEVRFEGIRLFHGTGFLGYAISCPKCGHNFVSADIIKPEVVIQQEGDKCDHCGAQLGEDDKVCHECGAPAKKPDIVISKD